MPPPKCPFWYPGCSNLCESGTYCPEHGAVLPDRMRGRGADLRHAHGLSAKRALECRRHRRHGMPAARQTMRRMRSPSRSTASSPRRFDYRHDWHTDTHVVRCGHGGPQFSDISAERQQEDFICRNLTLFKCETPLAIMIVAFSMV